LAAINPDIPADDTKVERFFDGRIFDPGVFDTGR
jgi:hypothetical protein